MITQSCLEVSYTAIISLTVSFMRELVAAEASPISTPAHVCRGLYMSIIMGVIVIVVLDYVLDSLHCTNRCSTPGCKSLHTTALPCLLVVEEFAIWAWALAHKNPQIWFMAIVNQILEISRQTRQICILGGGFPFRLEGLSSP